VRLATAALLVEVVRADEAVAGEEAAALYAELGQRFGLRMDESQRLIAAAEREADASVSLHQYTTLLNGALSPAEKLTMLELMWRVALADRVLDKHEEHLVRKVADLLHVPHAEVVRTKLRIQDASG
jgi:uncharacterized tellurite resistance protein B-like protein